jgi:outer membrane protein W
MKLFTKSKLLVVALSVSSFINAQSFTGGVLVGANMSNLSGVKDANKGIDKAKTKTGLSQGLFVRYDANSKWAVSFGFINSPKGATYDGSSTDSTDTRIGTSTYKYTDNLNYFEIPLLVHYKFASDDSRIKPYVSLGFAAAVRYSGKTDLDYGFAGKIGTKDTSYSAKPNINNYYKRGNIDYGIVGGAGLTYSINEKLNVGLDARYTMGLVDLNETKMPDTKLKNTSASVFLTLGYKFWSDAVSSKEVEKK